MPSSKGKPTDPQLREEVKEKVKNETNKDGGGKGQWSAWKVCEAVLEFACSYNVTILKLSLGNQALQGV